MTKSKSEPCYGYIDLGAFALTIGSVPRRTGFKLYINLIDCSFSTTSTNENDIIMGQFYVGPILPSVQRPPELQKKLNCGQNEIQGRQLKLPSKFGLHIYYLTFYDATMYLVLSLNLIDLCYSSVNP